MRFGMSARGLEFQSGGAKMVIQRIAEQLPEVGSEHEFVIFYDQPGFLGKIEYSHGNVQEVYVPSIGILDKVFREASRFVWDHFLLPSEVKKYNLDAMFFPKYERPLTLDIPSVVMFLDVGYLLPGLAAYKKFETIYKRFFLPNAARTADAIATISKSTKQETHRLIKGVDPNKIHVTYIDAAYKPPKQDADSTYVRDKYNIGKGKFVFLSSDLSPRKNIPRTLRAIAKVKDQIPHKFVMTGGKAWGVKGIEVLINELGIGDRFIKAGFVDHEDMWAVYKEADAYFHPSLYEGFGITLLEAMHVGTPVAYSNISSHPEVAEGAGLPFDPYDLDDMAQALIRICTDESLRTNLTAAGYKRIKQFDWKFTAQGVLELLEKVSK